MREKLQLEMLKNGTQAFLILKQAKEENKFIGVIVK